MTSTATTDRRGLFRAIAALALVAVAGTACTTTQPIVVGTPASLEEQVQPGDRVSLTTRDGREFEFEVVTVEPDALVGAEQRVEREEIVRLEVTRTSVAKTSGLVVGGYLTFFLVMVLLGVGGAAVALGAG